MADFLSRHWDQINWQTAFIAVAILTPIALSLFVLIAKHCRELLSAERAAHQNTSSSNEELRGEVKSLREENENLKNQIADFTERESRSDVELTDEEQIVLIAICANKMDELYRSRKISKQRISLAQDQLLKLGFVHWGVEGTYPDADGREWLDAHGLLE